jgi:hypothetical protein
MYENPQNITFFRFENEYIYILCFRDKIFSYSICIYTTWSIITFMHVVISSKLAIYLLLINFRL